MRKEEKKLMMKDEAFDFIQVVKKPTWERIHNNNVGTSILNHVFVDECHGRSF
jgi:hypothetical protein